MKFELTQDKIDSIVYRLKDEAILGNRGVQGYMDDLVKAIAYEAQKELVKWQEEMCVEHPYMGLASSCKQCFECQQELLNHFGVKEGVV